MHAHIEVKKDGKWFHYGNPAVQRNYLLFACTNGVRKSEFDDKSMFRDKIKPVTSVLKELPEDASEVTKTCLLYDSTGCTIHHLGCMDSDQIMELQQLLWRINTPHDPEWDLEDTIFRTYINNNSIGAHRGFEDSRIIFWFDN